MAGGLVGCLLLIGADRVLEATNKMEFCVSCHAMEQVVYQEYLRSPHNQNASGVVAECADCHVPKALIPKLIRKVQAANDIYHAILGTIDTPEKFEQRRMLLAERVWERMRANDSQACRNCHKSERIDLHKQSRRAQEKMQPGLEKGKTCIECHQGIAHTKPTDDEDE